ncbi:MAG: hypothetical protein HW388_1262 [Dehalococcoidia bacterium]|nr:hypothetical protein [Dehalococcoidia bacterium]
MSTNTISLEIFPWLTEVFVAGRTNRLRLEEERYEGDTVRSLLLRLAQSYPGFAQRVFDPKTQELSDQVSLFHNSRFLELVGGLDTPLAPGDELLLLPAWEGGC